MEGKWSEIPAGIRPDSASVSRPMKASIPGPIGPLASGVHRTDREGRRATLAMGCRRSACVSDLFLLPSVQSHSEVSDQWALR